MPSRIDRSCCHAMEDFSPYHARDLTTSGSPVTAGLFRGSDGRHRRLDSLHRRRPSVETARAIRGWKVFDTGSDCAGIGHAADGLRPVVRRVSIAVLGIHNDRYPNRTGDPFGLVQCCLAGECSSIVGKPQTEGDPCSVPRAPCGCAGPRPIRRVPTPPEPGDAGTRRRLWRLCVGGHPGGEWRAATIATLRRVLAEQ